MLARAEHESWGTPAALVARRARRARGIRALNSSRGKDWIIYIARECGIAISKRIRKRRRPRRRHERTTDAAGSATGNDGGGGREQVQAPDARPARSSVGNSRPLLSRTSTSFPAHRRRPLRRRARGRSHHTHRRPSAKNDVHSTSGSRGIHEQSQDGTHRAPSAPTPHYNLEL